jgi:hypothetical protein
MYNRTGQWAEAGILVDKRRSSMSGASLLTFMVAVWVVITAVFVALMVWKTFAGMGEEDTVILDPLEAKEATEQQKLITKMQRITSWAKGFGLASLALLIVTGAYYVYRGVTAFNG